MNNLAKNNRDWQISKCSVKERFRELWRLSLWTDCTFTVGDEIEGCVETIHSHKLILAATSPVFEALLFGGMAESAVNGTVRVPDIEPPTFKIMLEYIYSDALNLKSVDEAGNLMYASKKYIMPQLTRMCLDYLIENTCIKTVWDVLFHAQLLDEDELVANCLKVMSRYPYHVWASDFERLSAPLLVRLLESRHLNMKEPELWDMSVRWAEAELTVAGQEVTAQNIRNCLERAGALQKIRFLALSLRQFEELVAPTGILTSEEVVALTRLISGAHSDPVELPRGLNDCFEQRIPVPVVTWVCRREMKRGDRVSVYSGPVQTTVTSSNRVLVTGFEVVTRIASVTIPKSSFFSFSNTYRERLVVFIKDDQGNILAKTEHDATVEFNSFQNVTLNRPIWFEGGVKYAVLFDFPTGQYPLCHYTDTVLAKGALFEFVDSGKDRSRSSHSFISAVMYSI